MVDWASEHGHASHAQMPLRQLVFLPVVMRIHLQHEHSQLLATNRVDDSPLAG
jgi:hypothetical protein